MSSSFSSSFSFLIRTESHRYQQQQGERKGERQLWQGERAREREKERERERDNDDTDSDRERKRRRKITELFYKRVYYWRKGTHTNSYNEFLLQLSWTVSSGCSSVVSPKDRFRKFSKRVIYFFDRIDISCFIILPWICKSVLKESTQIHPFFFRIPVYHGCCFLVVVVNLRF